MRRRIATCSPALECLVLSTVVLLCILAPQFVAADYNPFEREREFSQTRPPFLSPAQNLRNLKSQIYNGVPVSQLANELESEYLFSGSRQQDLFVCYEPQNGRAQFESFATLYNRTFGDEDKADIADRYSLFVNTMKRTILLNRVVQNDVLNGSNYELKPEIRNYHFISPLGVKNAPLWYADINDCELGLIKHIVFDIFYLVDKNEMAAALKVATDNSEYLPLLNSAGFEQLANILIVRLYDRFRGDEKMNQLFQWPLYLKKLAGYAYNRRQASKADFQAKMPLVAFAYPSYFKDLKYNAPAVNRTGDNLEAHAEHERFNKFYGRKIASRQERNKRLVVFRQRWSLLNLLNEEESRKASSAKTEPDWQRARQVPAWYSDGPRSEKLTALGAAGFDQSANRYKQTQFSDLTDAEFVALLTNDFSLLENAKESAEFIDANFPIRPFDESFRNELAHELELRRALNTEALLVPGSLGAREGASAGASNEPAARSLRLARKVVDELISDVGLPIGSVFMGDISEQEHVGVFAKLAEFYRKPYAMSAGQLARVQQQQQQRQQAPVGQLSDSDLLDERQKRYEQFKQNYGRFRAWFVKENWAGMDETQTLSMLRLADLSWQEIKLILFKVCCLTDDSLARLSNQNATLLYLGSSEFLCRSISAADLETQSDPVARAASETTALELYYYYSVHFNKHHSNSEEFARRFAIFRRNVDQIRQHSCTRGLTLYSSFKLKKLDTLSTIDVLDPRRSYTDDINLDRYDYFNLAPAPQAGDHLRSARLQETEAEEFELAQQPAASRAAISYRDGPPLRSLLERPKQLVQLQSAAQFANTYVDKLTNYTLDLRVHAIEYRRNSVNKIYDLVKQRYRHCMRTVRNIDPGSDVRQQCQSAGQLADNSANLFANNYEFRQSRLTQARSRDGDQCNFYWQGLEPWNEGLIRQNPLSAQLIVNAKCL